MWVIGIDEAGRGSLVGELIIAAYGVVRQHEDELVRLGVREEGMGPSQAALREDWWPSLC